MPQCNSKTTECGAFSTIATKDRTATARALPSTSKPKPREPSSEVLPVVQLLLETGITNLMSLMMFKTLQRL